jgi:uncharacterized membrane protein YfcA
VIELPYAVAGFAVGAVVGLTGVGGGSLMTPLLVLGFGVPAVTAVGTDLLYAGLTKVGGAASHAAKGHVDWRVTALLASGSVPGSLLAVTVLAMLPPFDPKTRLLVTTALGVMLLATAITLAFRSRLLAWAASRANDPWMARHRTAMIVGLGAFIGVAVTFSSVGAGAIGVTVLILLFPALAATRIVGTDIAHAVPITLVAGAGHALLGNVDWQLLASLLAGSLPGILIGSQLTTWLPERAVRLSLVAVLLLAGAKLVAH